MAVAKADLCHVLNPPGEFTTQIPLEWSMGYQRHVTQALISSHAGHSVESPSVPMQMERHSRETNLGAEWPLPVQLAPIPLAELPTTTNLRDRAPFEAAAEEHRSEVLGVILKAHKSKATKEAQERRFRNAQSSKRSRDNRRIEERAAALKVKEMKQELDEIKLELQQNKEMIQQDKERIQQTEEYARQTEEYARQTEEYARQERERSRQERGRSRRVEAENERLRREVEELKQRK
ncbi:hypothetical protein E4U61_007654 [Claviceps capensis]|nr:hypothetical protein E4U61_007654 [Claviceps capensis]